MLTRLYTDHNQETYEQNEYTPNRIVDEVERGKTCSGGWQQYESSISFTMSCGMDSAFTVIVYEQPFDAATASDTRHYSFTREECLQWVRAIPQPPDNITVQTSLY